MIRHLLGILVHATVLSVINKKIMWETSMQSLRVIKKESVVFGLWQSKQCVLIFNDIT